MTVWDILRILVRRRALTLLGAAATLIAMALVASQQGVYWSQANVVFLAPPTADKPNALESTTPDLISTAGFVEQVVNAGVEKSATASNLTLLGRGVGDGYSIEQPDSGGQWSHNFEQALLNVQVTGPSEAVVRARLDRLVDRIRRTTRDLQARDDVAAKNVIRTNVAPADPPIRYASGSRTRALAGTLLLGVGLTVCGVIGVDQLAGRRRPTSRPPVSSPVSA